MKITKTNIEENDAWLTLKTDNEDEYCIIHVKGNVTGWGLSKNTLNIVVSEPKKKKGLMKKVKEGLDDLPTPRYMKEEPF